MSSRKLRTLNKYVGLNDYAAAPDFKNISNVVNEKIGCGGKTAIHARWRTAGVVLAAVLVLSAGSLAALSDGMGWHSKLVRYFKNPSSEKRTQTSISVGYPLVSETEDGITVNVLQTLADNHGIYVLYEVAGIGNVHDDDSFSWGKQRLSVKYDDADKKVGQGGYAYSKVIETKDNKCTMLYIRTGVANVKSQQLRFELETLKKSAGSGFDVMSNCKFDLKWDFKAVNSAKTFAVNKKINNGANEVGKVDISPISIWITITGEKLENIGNMEIIFKNQKKLTVENTEYNLQYTPLYGGVNTISYEFDELITVNEIESVKIGDNSIDIEQ